MSITSVWFPLFLAALLTGYYAVPAKHRWAALLAFSLIFDLALCGAGGLCFMLLTGASVYAAAKCIQTFTERQKAELKAKKELPREEKALIRAAYRRKKRFVLTGALILNFGVLCLFKYSNFFLSLFGVPPLFRWAAPLGISFYTFQATGYLVDVYWENARAEKNPLRFLLFVGFFAQITQGPISEYGQLAPELYEGKPFDYERFARGFQRLVWGFAKKMVLANLLSPYVLGAFREYQALSGLGVLLGAFGYSVQIYADFSGYMDIMCGACEMLGIRLTENFLRPYFSKSIAEYWRRWHISLGAWFKKYVYYPIAVARWNQKLGRKAKKALPASVALTAVWLLTGLWHGASLKYLAWGGVNGLFIIVSLWLEPLYARARKALRVSRCPGLFRAFQVVRTFFLVTLIKVLPEVGSLSDGFGFIARVFRGAFLPRSLSELLPGGATIASLGLCLIFTALLFLVSLVSRKRDARALFMRLPFAARIVLLAALIVFIVVCGAPAAKNAGGFMYAQF